MLLARKDKLAFPAGVAPGFDAKHVAAQGISGKHGISAISVPNAFLNLLNGVTATATGLVSKIDGILGPGTVSDSISSSLLFTGQSNANDTKLTFAAIATNTNTTVNQAYVVTCAFGVTGGAAFGTQSTGIYIYLFNAAQTVASSLVMTSGEPYFAGATIDQVAGIANFVLLNLRTGKLQTQVVTGTFGAPGPGDQFYSIGSTQGITQAFGSIAAAMHAPSYMSMPQLIKWAEDPWLFWYPDPIGLREQEITPATAFVPTFRTNVRQWMLPNATFYNQTAPPSGGGSIFNAAINAAASGAVSVGKSIGKSIAVACTSAMSLLKSVGKKIAVTCSGAVSIAKNVGKKIAATCSGAVTATAIKVKLVLVTAASTGAVAIQRVIGKPIASACSGAVSLVRNIGKSIAASCTGAVSSIKSITKKVLATCVGAVTAAAIKVKIVIVSAASSGAVVVIRAIGKPLAIVSIGSVSTAKVIAHAVNVASTTATSFAKLISKIVSATASAIVAITQNIGQSGHFVYNVAIAVSSSTLTQWLVRKVTKLTSREALPRNSGWPAAPRDDD